MSKRLACGAGCCFEDGVLEDEAFPANSLRPGVGVGCCLILDACDDAALLAYSFQAAGVVLTTETGRTVEGELDGGLLNQGEPFALVLSRPWALDGALLRGSLWTTFVALPLTMLGCCCLFGARRCGGLL